MQAGLKHDLQTFSIFSVLFLWQLMASHYQAPKGVCLALEEPCRLVLKRSSCMLNAPKTVAVITG